MKELFSLELRKAILNKWFLIAFIVGLTVAGTSAISGILMNAEWSEMGLKYLDTKYYPLSLTSCYKFWVVNDFTQPATDLFFFLLPLLAVIPYGWSYISEQKKGYFQQVVTRTSRMHYFTAKACAVFVSGCLVIGAPLLVNFLICACALPAYTPEAVEVMYLGIIPESFWSELFYTAPLLHTILFTLMNALFSGIWALAVCFLGVLLKNRLATMITPYLLLLFIRYFEGNILSSFALIILTPFDFLRGGGGDGYSGIVITFYMTILLMFFLVILFTLRTKDLV